MPLSRGSGSPETAECLAYSRSPAASRAPLAQIDFSTSQAEAVSLPLPPLQIKRDLQRLPCLKANGPRGKGTARWTRR
jgi:hypothetical protein